MTLPPLVAQARLATPLGPMTAAASAAGLAGLWFDGQKHHPGPLDAPLQASQPWLQAAQRALDAFFAGRPVALPPLDLAGTTLQRAVWQALLRLRPGQTIGWRQGFGILLDDLVAALCTLGVIALWQRLSLWWSP